MYNRNAYALGAQRSCIRELFEYGCRRAEEIGRENVLDFSLGNPSMPCPDAVTEAIRQILEDTDPVRLHGYTSAGGSLECRSAIAQDLNRRFGGDIRPEDLFITCGAAPALTAVFHALAVPGGEIVTPAPFFPEYRPFVESSGCAFRVLRPKDGGFSLTPEELVSQLSEQTVALIVNNPNNPSGTVLGRDWFIRLAGLLRQRQQTLGRPVYLISDEPYRELCYAGAEVPWLPSIYENTLICYSYSKSLSLPGERIGYVCVPRQVYQSDALRTAIAGAARSLGHVCAPSLWQKVIARCAGVRPDLTTYDRNRRMLYDALGEMGYEAAPPEGAFYLFVKTPGGPAGDFLDRAKARDLLLVPGDDFGCPGYFRMCYCIEPEKIAGALPIFRELIREFT